MKRFSVLLTAGAERDLENIFAGIREAQGEQAAERTLARLLKVGERLGRMPERGNYPLELVSIGVHEYRQVTMKPYRIIYRIVASQVFIMMITHARRDMQTLLAERLLRSGI